MPYAVSPVRSGIERETGRHVGYWVKARLDAGATILGLSKETGANRASLTNWLRSVGGRPRTLSEDMDRRYAMLGRDYVERVVQKAHDLTRERARRGELHFQHRNDNKYDGYEQDNARARRVAYDQERMLAVCHHCGLPFEIEIHHLNGKPWANEPDNLLPLCCACHNQLHALAYREAGVYARCQLDAWWSKTPEASA